MDGWITVPDEVRMRLSQATLYTDIQGEYCFTGLFSNYPEQGKTQFPLFDSCVHCWFIPSPGSPVCDPYQVGMGIRP